MIDHLEHRDFIRSVVDLTCRIEKGASYDNIVEAVKDACDCSIKGAFAWTDEEVVSMTDNLHLLALDEQLTKLRNGQVQLAKVLFHTHDDDTLMTDFHDNCFTSLFVK